ncbi:hypothetical protein VP1G_00986 [Cytospora mali]|uniref:Rhodopsin domain-containing protein n=1 Tax=Cytospora mali TaxID=578113 RepID=A0A194UPN9_CYTMA|nr:hypothetical protein VP1G_00986 [Valsa mali var. pyri (nom. inval.)]
MQEGLDMAKLQAADCHFSNESKSTDVLVVMSVLYGVTVAFVLLRVLSKLMTQTFCTEDHLIICALLLSAVSFVCAVYMAELGFGSHIWELKDGALLRILRLLYIGEIIYIVVLTLTKASIVCMYLRIFWAYPPFQKACYVVLGYIILPSIVIIFLTIFSCQPIQYFWDRDLTGSCRDVTAVAFVNSGFAVSQDLVIILLPVYMLWNLNMNWKRKIFIGIMFAIGGLGLIATIIRLRTLFTFGDLSDPTWSYVPLIYWTTVELSAGIVVSCLPAVRILLERFFKVFNLSTTNSKHPSAINLQQRRTKPSAPENLILNYYGGSETRLNLSRDEISTTSLRRTEESVEAKQDIG